MRLNSSFESGSMSAGALAHLLIDTVTGIPSSFIVTVSFVAFRTSYGPVILNGSFDCAILPSFPF